MSRMIFRFVAFAMLLTVITPYAVSAELKLGVLAPRGELKANARWQDFAEYLSGELGEKVTLVPLTPASVTGAANGGKIDLLLSHSPHTVYVEEKLGANVLATLNTKAGPHFAGVIIAKKGSGIKSAEDLRGKNVMSLKFKAAAGAYIFQTYHLMQKGIDPHKDFASIKEGKKQDDLVLAVKSGLIDAAFVRTGLLENMQREGKINMDDFVVVDQRTDPDFALVHSTVLYPEWCISAVSEAAKKSAGKISGSLFKLSPDSAAATKARIKGFIKPVSLTSIKQALKNLHIAPYS